MSKNQGSSYDPNARRSFSAIPQGTYTVRVKEIDPDKVSNAGNPKCNIAMLVDCGNYEGRYLFDSINFQEKFNWKWVQFFDAATIEVEAGFAITPESIAGLRNKIEGSVFRVVVSHQIYQGEKQAKIKEYITEGEGGDGYPEMESNTGKGGDNPFE